MKKESKTTVENYKFEPIKGYPMLNWRGKRPFTITQFYPAQIKEAYGKHEQDGWINKIFWGDNLQVMSHLLKDFRGKVDLVYIDPPFNSKADYKKKIKFNKDKVEGNISSFEEKQYSDMWANDEYLQFMYDRLILIRELLSESGYIFLHCDSTKVHHLRCIMDEIFGAENFMNEIIWSYRRWPSVSNNYQEMHDNILAYYKNHSVKHTFNKIYEGASDSYMKRFGGKTQILDADSGTRKITSEEETKGMPLRDVWELSIIAGFGAERTGYPTQKPETLLERIIQTTTNERDIVFDCFMGSGTTQAVALKNKRRFLGSDINLGAITTVTKRLNQFLNEAESGFQVFNVNNYEVFKNPVEAKELLKEALEITPLTGTIFDGEKDGRLVKIMPVNRIATRADLNELINGFDYKHFKKRKEENPNKPVEKILLICMGHELDLKANLVLAVKDAGFEVDVEVVDILRDKTELQFKRESEAKISIKKGNVVIEKFYPMNLLQKLSLQKSKVTDWRDLVESVMIDWNYDGAILSPTVIDITSNSHDVSGEYQIPKDAGTIRVKITDLLSESIEVEVHNG